MDTDQIKLFQKTRFGWMDPEGDLVACDLHDHLKVLRSHPLFSQAIQQYEQTVDDNQSMMDADLASLGPDEHPAMHRFASMNDEAKDLLSRTIYKAGWVRIGMAYDWANTKRTKTRAMQYAFMVEAEGLKDNVLWVEPQLRDLADIMDARLSMRLMEVQMVPAGRRGHRQEEELVFVGTRGV